MNACKLTECAGMPRCEMCTRMDAAYPPPAPTVRRIVGPTIMLASGRYFDLEAPETSEFGIEDIAHALSLICRYTGLANNLRVITGAANARKRNRFEPC